MQLELLQILACPACKGKLIAADGAVSLHCPSCLCDYPVIDGIPILLPPQVSTASRSTCGAA